MVYYHTSGNIKMLRNLLLDYEAASEISPDEYMTTYIKRCPENIDDAKITWIVNTFLGLQKHLPFLRSIASRLSEELSDEEQEFFMIVFYAVTFQIGSKDLPFLYKCLFNLSKPLLNTFTKFLGNNEFLTFITQMAQSHYDTNYITDKIIAPLFTWQPYISEMGHTYGEYVQMTENRKIKPKTIPLQPNVLNRKFNKQPPSQSGTGVFPATPPNSLNVKKSRKMLTKSAIDQKLNHLHEKNKRKATYLLNKVKNYGFHYAEQKSDLCYRKLSAIKYDVDNEFTKPMPKTRKKIVKHNTLPVKETAATLKKLNKRVQLTEQNEVQWLADLLKSCKITGKAEEMEEYDRQEKEKERLYDIERKHLMGQISYEEAIIAKKKLHEDNKKKYEEFLKEKESWNNDLEIWKKAELEKNRKFIEELALNELSKLQAKHKIIEKNKAIADKQKKESEILLEQMMRTNQEELERRVKMIKEIKILAMIAKQSKLPKIIDLTETPGFGFLCEMSIAELQERLVAMKIGFKEQLDHKKRVIKEENMAAKQNLQQTKDSIKAFMTEHVGFRKQKKKSNITLDSSSAKELSKLKTVLEEKRKLRTELAS